MEVNESVIFVTILIGNRDQKGSDEERLEGTSDRTNAPFTCASSDYTRSIEVSKCHDTRHDCVLDFRATGNNYFLLMGGG